MERGLRSWAEHGIRSSLAGTGPRPSVASVLTPLRPCSTGPAGRAAELGDAAGKGPQQDHHAAPAQRVPLCQEAVDTSTGPRDR